MLTLFGGFFSSLSGSHTSSASLYAAMIMPHTSASHLRARERERERGLGFIPDRPRRARAAPPRPPPALDREEERQLAEREREALHDARLSALGVDLEQLLEQRLGRGGGGRRRGRGGTGCHGAVLSSFSPPTL